MNREETKKILMIIQAAYPNYRPDDKTTTVNLCTEILSDFSYQQVSAAVKSYIRVDKKGFAPSIGDIVDKVQMLFGDESKNDAEAWQTVWKAIRNSGDFERAKQNFEKFPEVIKKSVGSPGQLRDWALTKNLNIEVVSANFKRTYRTELQLEREKQKFSPDISKIIKSKAIPDHESSDRITVAQEGLIAEKKSKIAPENMVEKVKELLAYGKS